MQAIGCVEATLCFYPLRPAPLALLPSPILLRESLALRPFARPRSTEDENNRWLRSGTVLTGCAPPNRRHPLFHRGSGHRRRRRRVRPPALPRRPSPKRRHAAAGYRAGRRRKQQRCCHDRCGRHRCRAHRPPGCLFPAASRGHGTAITAAKVGV